jgi:hypothetical protein
MSALPVFFANKVGSQLVVVRRDSLPSGTRPDDALGLGTHTIRALDSERARSALAARYASGIGIATAVAA